jgi:hypothetical protein
MHSYEPSSTIVTCEWSGDLASVAGTEKSHTSVRRRVRGFSRRLGRRFYFAIITKICSHGNWQIKTHLEVSQKKCAVCLEDEGEIFWGSLDIFVGLKFGLLMRGKLPYISYQEKSVMGSNSLI